MACTRGPVSRDRAARKLPAALLALVLAAASLALGLGAAAARAQGAPPGSAEPPDLTPGTMNPLEELNRMPSKPVSEVTSPVDPMTYRVGPGDVFEVHFAGALSQTMTLVVSPEGSVFMRGYGTIPVGGMTLDSARTEIRRKVGGGAKRQVQIDVQLTRVRILRVYPTGVVTSTAPLELPATARVSDALEPGRLIASGGSHRNVVVHHRDGSTEVADIGRFTRLADPAFNPILRDDDVLQVPSERTFVEVAGAVATPQRLELGPADSLRTLLALGGGPLEGARRDSAMFVRWTSPTARESSWVTVDDVARGALNPPLRDGDQLFVYFLPEYHRMELATIVGEVQQPGVYPLTAGKTRLSDLVKAAGGFRDRADLRAIRVYRARPGPTGQDPELERLTKLARSQMTNTEYALLQSRLAQRREDYRVDWTTLAHAPENDFVLLDGDLVTVDRVDQSVRVEGEVRQPGLVHYQPGMLIEDYIASAGGFTARAMKPKVVVTRAVSNQTVSAYEVSEVNPGDMIYVPEKSDRTIWDNLIVLITVGAQMATIYIAVRH